MRKLVFVLTMALSFLFIGCSSARFNAVFEKIGMFDEQIKLNKITSPEKEVVFFPMIHLSTKAFYADVKYKIDSLENKGYFFLYEEFKRDKNNLQEMKKLVKIGLPMGQKYSQILKEKVVEKYNVQLKKEIEDQPMPKEMGMDDTNSINADMTSKKFIEIYEKEHGEIILNRCEQKASSLDEMRKCKKNYFKINNKQMDIVVDGRNDIVISEVVKSPHSKIAIIYGSNHWKGIKKILVEKYGFSE